MIAPESPIAGFDDTSPELAASRLAATRNLTIYSALQALGIGAATLAVGGPGLAVGGLALLLAAFAEGVRRAATGPTARLSIGFALMGQVTLLIAGFAGHPWQIDMHMLVFAVLALLAALADPRVLVAAAGLAAVHHLSLVLVMPALVFPGDGIALARVMIHAAVVVLETGALVWMASERLKLDTMATHARHEAESEAERARAAAVAVERAEREGAERRDRLMGRLEREFGEMVARGRAGDFAHRMSGRFEEEVLNRLSEGFNALYAEVDSVFDDMQGHLDAISAGRLDAEIDRPREGRFEATRESLNATARSLHDLVDGITRAVARTRAGADEIEEGAGAGARRAESAAASLEETAAAMEEIASTFATSSERLGDAERMAADITARTETGAAASADAVAAVARIEESSSRISDIISVIDSIAFRTNLLALNAAVEAARAGEAGKGFAVVASEVRNLAQRSSEAARDIAALIKESAEHVTDGVRLVENAGGALSQISQGAGELAAAVGDIAAAGREQAQGVAEVNAAIGQLDATTQENAAAAEASAAAARRLRGEVDALAALVSEVSARPAGLAGRRAA